MSEFAMPQTEIERRIREIQSKWDYNERSRRMLVGETRRETLETILQSLCEMKAA